jgi:class 3 adenylate cyclase
VPRDLVEKFVEVNSWPTARKTAVVAGPLVLPGHLIGGGATYLLMREVPGADTTGLLLAFGIFWVFSPVCSLLCWYVDRRGYAGEWTFYFFAITYSSATVYLTYLYGAQSSPLLVWFAMQVYAVGVLYDAVRALVYFAIGLFDYGVLFWLSTTDLVDYAPVHGDRTLEAQQEPIYVIAMAFTVLLYLIIGVAIAFFSARAQNLMKVRLDQAHQQLDEAAHLIARYVPAELAEDIFAGHGIATDGHQRRKLTVFFSDLVGFSDIAEELEPEDLAVVLNEYFTEMTAIARKHGGTVDELQGDALLILFGAPHQTTDRDQALRAVAMATEMHDAMASLNARWRDAGITEVLRVRMGINTGVVTVGHFGSAERVKYAALGKHVNIAARLQAIAHPGATVLSYATYLLVKDSVACTSLGEQQLKGIVRPVEAFEVNGAVRTSAP